jgi:hypothetical protein
MQKAKKYHRYDFFGLKPDVYLMESYLTPFRFQQKFLRRLANPNPIILNARRCGKTLAMSQALRQSEA